MKVLEINRENVKIPTKIIPVKQKKIILHQNIVDQIKNKT